MSKLIEEYDLEMNYENFDETEIYRKIKDYGIESPTETDIAFDYIKKTKHPDIIAEETRRNTIQKKYLFSDAKASIKYSDDIIRQIKEKEAQGEPISNEDIETMLDNAENNNDFCRGDIDKIKERIKKEPTIHDYLNDNLYIDVYENPKYTDCYTNDDISKALKVVDKVKAYAKQNKQIDANLIKDYIKSSDIDWTSTEDLVYTLLQDMGIYG